jgi:hypothetical protein
MDNRAVAPVVGKLLAAGIAIMYIAGTTTLLLGGVVPEYRTAAGAELGERVLSTAAGGIEQAVPDAGGAATVRVRIDLPSTIRNAGYSLELRNRTLRLEHPVDGIGGRARIEIPSQVTVTDNTWQSGDQLIVEVSGRPAERTISLQGENS